MTQKLTISTLLHNGKEYLLGSAGSLVLSCPKCGAESFRDSFFYFRRPDPENETCLLDGTVLKPIRAKDPLNQ